jgi:hypothetical protein
MNDFRLPSRRRDLRSSGVFSQLTGNQAIDVSVQPVPSSRDKQTKNKREDCKPDEIKISLGLHEHYRKSYS